MRLAFLGWMLAAACLVQHAAAAGPAGAATVPPPALTDVHRTGASAQVLHVARWAIGSADHGASPFIVVDKVQARVFVFDRGGQLLGASPALVGLTAGDDSVPGIGTRAMSTIGLQERTTPAGRYVAWLQHSLHGDEILWVDYDTAIALHRVVTGTAKERRLQRLASQVAADRRITFGCINVPVRFFEDVVLPAFRPAGGIVYVLPETRPATALFGSFEMPEGANGSMVPVPAPVPVPAGAERAAAARAGPAVPALELELAP